MPLPAPGSASPTDGLHYWVAAVRECFEEAGLLFATDASGAMVDLHALPADEVVALRRALHANQTGMAEVCERFGVRLATDRLAYYSHWITPKGLPKIFDTRFFITEAPAGQTAQEDATETVELLWLTPAEVLARARAEADERHRGDAEAPGHFRPRRRRGGLGAGADQRAAEPAAHRPVGQGPHAGQPGRLGLCRAGPHRPRGPGHCECRADARRAGLAVAARAAGHRRTTAAS